MSFLEDVVPASSSHTYYLIAGRSSRPLSPDAVATKINQSIIIIHGPPHTNHSMTEKKKIQKKHKKKKKAQNDKQTFFDEEKYTTV
jgi:hypothetical protein